MLKAFLGFTLIFLMSTLAFAFNQKKPIYVMGALGDSITAGAIADLPRPTFFDNHDEEIRVFDGKLRPPMLVEHKRTMSWASGKFINSHYVRLKKYYEEKEHVYLKVMNVAESGGNVKDLPRQAKLLVKAVSKKKNRILKYVTVFAGSNDLCKKEDHLPNIDREKMRDRMRLTFKTLASLPQKEPIKVLVVGLNNIPQLGRPEISTAKTYFGTSCHHFRDEIIKACRSLHIFNSEQEYRERVDFVRSFNSLLRSTAAEANSEFANLDVRYSDALFKLNITKNMVAVDCFHPDNGAHEIFADLLWKDQPWF